MTYTVAPPAVNTWDVDAVNAAALDVLRLGAADVDAGRVFIAAATAVDMIDYELDCATPIDTRCDPTLQSRAVALTVTLYHDATQPTGGSDSFLLDPTGDDPMATIRKSIVRRKQRFGVG